MNTIKNKAIFLLSIITCIAVAMTFVPLSFAQAEQELVCPTIVSAGNSIQMLPCYIKGMSKKDPGVPTPPNPTPVLPTLLLPLPIGPTGGPASTDPGAGVSPSEEMDTK